MAEYPTLGAAIPVRGTTRESHTFCLTREGPQGEEGDMCRERDVIGRVCRVLMSSPPAAGRTSPMTADPLTELVGWNLSVHNTADVSCGDAWDKSVRRFGIQTFVDVTQRNNASQASRGRLGLFWHQQRAELKKLCETTRLGPRPEPTPQKDAVVVENSSLEDTGTSVRHRRGTAGAQSLHDQPTLSPRGTLPHIPQPPSFSPAAILDGSKLLLRLGRFTMDAPCKILLATPNLKYERPLAWQTTVTATEQQNTVVIDTNLFGNRFIPIPLTHYGTVYTRNGTVHVTVGSMVKRAKIYSRNLPYRACNRFHSLTIAEPESESEEAARTAAAWFLERQSTSRALGSIDPDQAVQMIRRLSSNPQQGIVYIRADDSLVRYTLKHDDRIELPAGRVVAWTVGVRFEMSNYCCFRTVNAVQGEGTVWIQNSRTVTSRALAGNGTLVIGSRLTLRGGVKRFRKDTHAAPFSLLDFSTHVAYPL